MSKKKRNKKYRPTDGTTTQPVIHQYVAEDEDKADRKKRFKRKFILYGVMLAILALLGSWIF